MTDRYDQENILGYIEGELDDAQRDAFEAILAHDHELRNLVSQMRLDREALRSLGNESVPVGLIDHVIQAQERSELLGDPEAPEPLPLTMPVNRYKLRRVLAYSGIAAVLLLSAALVVPTLMPSGLLDYKAGFAKNDSGSDATNVTSPDVGSGLAMIDEDAVYDESATRSLARVDADRSLSDQDKVIATDTTELVEAKIEQPQPVFTDAEQETPQEQPAAPVASALAMAGQTDTDDALASDRDAARELDLEEAGTPTATIADVTEVATAEVELIQKVDDTELAKAENDRPLDDHATLALAPAPDPFIGYDNAPVVTDQTQLLVNASSPTQARRDIRDWAIANSVRVVEEPAERTVRGEGSRPTATLRRARTFSLNEPRGPATTNTAELIVEIDQEKLPDLLVFLNRTPSQHAELVTLADADTATRQSSPADERSLERTESWQARDADQADSNDQPKARANRMVDTKSAWPKPGLATGLAPMASSADRGSRQPEKQNAEPPDDTQHRNDLEAEPARTPAAAQPFDWGKLLDNLTIQPVSPPSPLLQPEPRERLRLRVIIRQVADEAHADDLRHD